MAISAAELIAYLSANMPTNDTGTSGGAILTTGKVADLVLAAADALEVVSSAAGDTTQTCTVFARKATGEIVSEGVTLNGTTPVAFPTISTVERVLRVTLSATATGTVTLRRTAAGATVVTLEAGYTSAHRTFYDAASDPGSGKVRYEKIFWKNTNGTSTLSAAIVKLTADPEADYKIGLATAKGDSGSVTNRLTAPGGVSFVDDDVAASVPTNTLAAGEAIGVWVEQTLAAAAAATKTTYTTQLSGTTV